MSFTMGFVLKTLKKCLWRKKYWTGFVAELKVTIQHSVCYPEFQCGTKSPQSFVPPKNKRQSNECRRKKLVCKLDLVTHKYPYSRLPYNIIVVKLHTPRLVVVRLYSQRLLGVENSVASRGRVESVPRPDACAITLRQVGPYQNSLGVPLACEL